MSFDGYLDNIYAAFGKNRPSSRIANAIYERVEQLPSEFMEWAKKRLQDEEKLPANLGAYLKNILWPEWKQANPEKIINVERQRCPRCAHNLPGFKRFWEPDSTPHECACDCNHDENDRKNLGYLTDAEILARGWILELPEQAWDNERTQGLIRGSLRARMDAQRKAHIDYTQKYVELD